MSLTLVTAPTTEPLTVAEAKAHLLINTSSGEPVPTAPTVALPAVAVAGNCDNGAHRVGFTFVTADGETDLGPLSGVVTVADKTVNGKIYCTAVALGGSAVTSRKAYLVPVAGGAAKYAATLSDNTSTTLTLSVADSALGAESPTTNTTSDPELVSWITAARQFCETFTHRALVTQTWDLKLDAFPYDDCIYIPKAPLVSVTSITYTDSNGDSQTVSSANYTVVAPSGPECSPGYIVPGYGLYWPVTRSVPNAVIVRFVAGYGAAASVPAGIKAAMKLLIGHWHANREAVNVGNITTELPLAVNSLLWPYKAFAAVAA